MNMRARNDRRNRDSDIEEAIFILPIGQEGSLHKDQILENMINSEYCAQWRDDERKTWFSGTIGRSGLTGGAIPRSNIQSERNKDMRRIFRIGHDKLPSETAISQLSREFGMTRRKLRHFSKEGGVNKSSLNLELNNQSSRVIKVIVKAGASIFSKSHGGNRTGKKLDGIINGAKVSRSGVGRRKFFASHLGSPVRSAGRREYKQAHSSRCRTWKYKIL